MKKRVLWLALAAFVTGACARVAEPVFPEGEVVTIRAYQEGVAACKTMVEDGGTQVLWEPSDAMNVFFNGTGGRFVSQNSEPAAVAVFSGTLNILVDVQEGESSSNLLWGVYPYRANATSDGMSVTTTLPAEQTGRAGSFATGTHITLACSHSYDFAFYNVTGGVRFSLTQPGIKKVTFRGNNGEALAGKVKLAFADGLPTVLEVTDAETTLSLTAPDGGTFETGEWYYIESLPVSLAEGFTMTFHTADASGSLKTSSQVSVLRGTFGSLANADAGVAFTPDDTTGMEEITVITISDTQKADVVSGLSEADQLVFDALTGGLKLNFQMSGITKLEIESVDANPLAGEADIIETDGTVSLGEIGSPHSIITFLPADGGMLEAGKDYFVRTFPCDVYGGYRLSIFRDGQVAHFFGVHQIIEAGGYISPLDLIEDDLEFDDPDAPLVEEERPELDSKTKELLRAYKKNPCLDTYNALYEQMGVRYDKVVARKKAKLRELEREAKHQKLIDEMQAIVDEMVNNREERLEQRFLSLIDSRKDDNPDDEWLVLKGATEGNCYVGYTPVTNAEYAAFDAGFTYTAGQERYPAVNVSIAQAQAYCDWLGTKDAVHAYRLPTEYEWILAAGHMPKDIKMNSNHIESGLTSVDAYASSKGGCGGIDFWGNCWEWTSTKTASGQYIIKGGAWDSTRDECRSEYSDASCDGSKGYANVGIRVVRVDR